jgi:hypothetical protein
MFGMPNKEMAVHIANSAVISSHVLPEYELTILGDV